MQELATRYGEKVAQAIVDYKLSTPEIMSDEVRWHPDAPEVEAGYCTCYSIRLLLKSSSNFMQRFPCSVGSKTVLGLGFGKHGRDQGGLAESTLQGCGGRWLIERVRR